MVENGQGVNSNSGPLTEANVTEFIVSEAERMTGCVGPEAFERLKSGKLVDGVNPNHVRLLLGLYGAHELLKDSHRSEDQTER